MSFFSFGNLRSAFIAQTRASPLMQALWKKSTSPSSVNSASTLPLQVSSKAAIYLQVSAENKGLLALKIKTKQSVAYAKELMRFYKHGVSVVWKNQWNTRRMVRSELALERFLDKSGKETAVRIPNFRVLTKTMAQSIYMSSMEKRADDLDSGVVIHKGPQQNEPVVLGSNHGGLFGISRDTYQLLRRTPGDFIKIPGFAVIFAIFMEMTPILCYVFPEITPSTCVLPSLLPRIWPKQNMDKLAGLDLGVPQQDYVFRTAYNIPSSHLLLLCSSLRLKSKYVPSFLYPEGLLRNRLQDYFNYLCVDNYFLSGLNGDGNIWDLNPLECVLACLERNLIADLPALVKVLSSGTVSERENAIMNLKFRLFKFIVDFSTSNVGYLVVAPLIVPESEFLSEWRKELELPKTIKKTFPSLDN